MADLPTNVYVGIDVAFAKRKRLPVVVCRFREERLEPLPLRTARVKPPAGKGNASILDSRTIESFANETAAYLKSIEGELCVHIRRIAIDSPSAPKLPETQRRACEIGLDNRNIHCITTPSTTEFDAIRLRAAEHLQAGGAESRIPSANQLWMLVGFELFKRLGNDWDCIEVFPQAIAAVLNANRLPKTCRQGLAAQLGAVADYTKWPPSRDVNSLRDIGYGSAHDRLDAYMAAWVAALTDDDRIPIGNPPNDAIWVPRVRGMSGNADASRASVHARPA